MLALVQISDSVGSGMSNGRSGVSSPGHSHTTLRCPCPQVQPSHLSQSCSSQSGQYASSSADDMSLHNSQVPGMQRGGHAVPSRRLLLDAAATSSRVPVRVAAM